MKAHAKSHTHCQVARKSRSTSQNLSISMSFANAPRGMKLVAKLKDKMTENKECQCLTKAIPHLRFSAILKSQSKNVTLEI